MAPLLAVVALDVRETTTVTTVTSTAPAAAAATELLLLTFLAFALALAAFVAALLRRSGVSALKKLRVVALDSSKQCRDLVVLLLETLALRLRSLQALILSSKDR